MVYAIPLTTIDKQSKDKLVSLLKIKTINSGKTKIATKMKNWKILRKTFSTPELTSQSTKMSNSLAALSEFKTSRLRLSTSNTYASDTILTLKIRSMSFC